MKVITATVAALILTLSLSLGVEVPKTLKTKSGKVYEGAKLRKAEPDGLLISHSGGIAKVLFTDLPEDIQAQFGYDPQKALEFQAALAEQRKNQAAIAANAAEASARAERELRAMAESAEKRAEEASEAQNRAAWEEANSAQFLVEISQSVEGGILGRYRPVVEVEVDASSGAIRRTAVEKRWGEQSEEVALFKAATGFDGDSSQVIAYPDGEFQYVTVLGAAKKVRAFKVIRQAGE